MKKWLLLCLVTVLSADPWMDPLVEKEFLPFQKGISQEALELTWEQCKPYGELFRRFRVIQGVVYGPESQTKNLLRAIAQKYSLPDIAFIHHNHDILYGDWFKEGFDYAPIFVSAKEIGNIHTVLFMDWYYDVDATGPGSLNRLIKEINENITRFEWNSRIDRAFWRGSTNDGYYTPQNWTEIPRGRLVWLSKMNPTLIDAAFTWHHSWNVSDLSFFQNQIDIAPYVHPVEQMQYKYQIDLDGTTPTFPALHWKLFTGSLIFKQHPGPKGTLWYHQILIPWKHFIPLQPDLGNLEKRILWAKRYEKKAKRIAENGRNFALTHLMPEHILLYCYKMLLRYASLQKFKPCQLIWEEPLAP